MRIFGNEDCHGHERYRDFCAGVPEAVDRVAAAHEVHMPFVTLADLRAGFLCGTVARRNEATLLLYSRDAHHDRLSHDPRLG